jgi:glutamate carboxypeptidase
MGSERALRIRDFLQAEEEGIVGLLERLVAAESPTHDPESQRAVQTILTDELRELGYRIRWASRDPGGRHLLAIPTDRSPGAPLQIVLGHTDTVWPTGTLENRPFQRFRGRVVGPGVYDMKSGLTLLVFALRAMRSVGAEPEVAPVIFLNCDEESGSLGSAYIVRRLARIADRVYVLEPSLGRRGRLKTARKGVGHFTIRVTGRAAHAGLEPGHGASAILELSHLVQHLFALNDPKQGISVNVGTIDGGLSPNVVAPEGKISVDFRVLTLEQADELERCVRSLETVTPNTRIEVLGGLEKPPMERTPRELWQLAQVAARELELDLAEGLAGGASDGNVASLYAPTLDGLGPVGGGAHAAHEFIELTSLIERSALLSLLLLAPPLERSRATSGRRSGRAA